MSETSANPRRYSFGPRTRSGLTFGVSWPQASLLAASLLIGVLLLRVGHGRGRLLVAALVLLASFVTATWPIAGKTPQQWLPVLVRFGLAMARGERRSAPVTRGGPLSQRPKPPFADLSLQALSGPSGEIGVLLDRRNSTASAILDVAGTPFALADQAARQQLIDSWTGFLESTAQQSGSLVRLAWIERVVPDQALSLRVDAEHAFASPGTEAIEIARSSYLALLASESRRGAARFVRRRDGPRGTCPRLGVAARRDGAADRVQMP